LITLPQHAPVLVTLGDVFRTSHVRRKAFVLWVSACAEHCQRSRPARTDATNHSYLGCLNYERFDFVHDLSPV